MKMIYRLAMLYPSSFCSDLSPYGMNIATDCVTQQISYQITKMTFLKGIATVYGPYYHIIEDT
jgi:hypothetical protein